MAIEGSDENFRNLKSNLGKQYFDLCHLKVINQLISNKKGKTEFTTSLGANNSMMINSDNEQFKNLKLKYDLVNTDTLYNVLKNENFLEDIDFIKIDIEGAEPLVIDDLLKIKPKSMFIEFSNKNSLDNNLNAISKLVDSGYFCSNGNNRFSDYFEVEKFIENVWQNKGIGSVIRATDLWFFKNQTQNGR